MEYDVIKVSENCPVNSSSLLTDWLFKYKLDNISYLSSPQSIHAHITKNSRKGGIFDSRDIIRPTVQLFKNIRSKNKRRNETPSPQRTKPKAITIPSPTKESNRIFNHKGAGEDALDSYRKIYTYGKVKQDKVSRDKIESAVALHRQREQEKENSANRPPPEKSKRVENKEVISFIPKFRKGTKVNKHTTKEAARNLKTPCKTEDKQQKESQDIKSCNVSKEREKKAQSGDSKKNEELEYNEVNKQCKKNLPNKVGLKEKKNIMKTKEVGKNNKKNNCTEEENIQINNCIKDSSELKLDKDPQSSRSIQRLNKINSDNQTEKSQINVINFMKDLEIESQSRESLIKSLKSKCSQKEFNKSSLEVLSKKKLSTTQVDKSTVQILSNRKLPTADYIIIKPAFINKEVINVQVGVKTKIKKSVDDLLREYRIKYRNMIKFR